MDGPGIESRWGRDIQHTSRLALRPTQPPVQWVPGHSQGKQMDHLNSTKMSNELEVILFEVHTGIG